MRRPSPASLATAGALGIILCLAAILAGWGNDYGLPHPTGRPDEEIVVQHAFQILASGNLDPDYFDYPHLHMYHNAMAFYLYYQVGRLQGRFNELWDFLFAAVVLEPGLHYRIARTVTILFALGGVFATYFLGRKAYDSRAVGLLAALALATCHIHVISAHFATVDVTATFYVTVSLIFAVGAARNGRLRDYLLAGIFGGFAASTKYNAGMVVLALCVPTAIRFIGASDAKERGNVMGKLFLAGVVSVAAFSLTSPYAVINYDGILWSLENFQLKLYSANDERAVWVHLKRTFPEGMGWPFYLIAVAGVVRALWRRRPSDVALLAFLLPFFVSMGTFTVVYPRYIIPLVPIMAVLAAELLWSLPLRQRAPLAITSAIALSLPGLIYSVRFDRVAAEIDTRVLAAEWVAENLPKRSKIALCKGWGAPAINGDRRRPPAFEPVAMDCFPELVLESGAPYLITYIHPAIGRPELAETMRAMLEERGKLMVSFSPFRVNTAAEPHFYPRDAFYIPLAGLSAVERGGPVVDIWEIKP